MRRSLLRLMTQLSDLEKQLLTVHYRIHELLERDRLWHNLREEEVSQIYKACKKLLKNCKDSKWNTTKDSYGDKWTHVLESNLGDEGKQKRRYDERPGEYLTWVSFGTHHIIRKFLPNWTWLEDDTRKELKKFYKQTLEMLTR